MAFCSKCGKQLNEGEVCSCQTAAPKQASNIDVTALANGIVDSAKEIVTNPEEGAKKFVSGISWLNMGILTAIYAVITALFSIWNKIEANLEYRKELRELADKLDMSFKKYCKEFDVDTSVYDFGDIVKGVFSDVIYLIAGIAVSAVVFYFAIKLIKKVQISWQTAFALATIELVIFIPCTLVYNVLGMIPSFKLLSWIMGAISSARSIGAILVTYLGLKSVCGDSKSTVYTIVPTYAICSFATSFIYFLLNELF